MCNNQLHMLVACCKTYIHPVLILTLSDRAFVSMSVHRNFGTFGQLSKCPHANAQAQDAAKSGCIMQRRHSSQDVDRAVWVAVLATVASVNLELQQLHTTITSVGCMLFGYMLCTAEVQ